MRIRITPEKTKRCVELFDDPNMRRIAFDLLHSLGINETRISAINERINAITRAIQESGDYQEILIKGLGLEPKEAKNLTVNLKDPDTKNLTSSSLNLSKDLLAHIFSFIDEKELKTTTALTKTCKAFNSFFQPGLDKIKARVLSLVLIQELVNKLGNYVLEGKEVELNAALEIIRQSNPELSKALLEEVFEKSAHVKDFRDQKLNGTLLELAEHASDIVMYQTLSGFLNRNPDIQPNFADRKKEHRDMEEKRKKDAEQQMKPYLKAIADFCQAIIDEKTDSKAKEPSEDTYCGFKRGFLIGKRF